MPEFPVTEFGSRLKQARLARGISLAQIAAVTKISARSLEAVERNDFSKLPGGIFTRAFVRAYAGEVGLDPEAALQQFLEQCPAEMAAVPTDAPESIDGRPRHAEWQEKLSWRHAAVVLAVLALLVAVWFAWQRRPAPPAENPRAEGPIVAAPPSEPPPPVRRPAIATEPAVQPAVATSSSTAPSRPANARALTVQLALTSPCWVWASADGAAIASRMFAAGEHLDVTADRLVVLKLGDAAAIALTINGQAARPLGTRGRVITVRISPDSWRTLVQEP